MTKAILNLLTNGQTQMLAAVNALLGLLIVFHVVLTQVQFGGIDVAVNAVLAVVAFAFTGTAKTALAKSETPIAPVVPPAAP